MVTRATMVRATIDEGVFDIELVEEQEYITVYSATAGPDPAWTYTDAAGHFHAVAANGQYPTLRFVQDEPDWMDSEGEEHPGRSHEECLLCGEHVVPGTKMPPGWGEQIPGMRSWRMTVRGGFEVQRFTPGTEVSVHTDDSFGHMRCLTARVEGSSIAPPVVIAEFDGWMAKRATTT